MTRKVTKRRKRKTYYLRQYRLAKGLNQEQLAAEIGVTQPTISRAESGENPADTDLLASLAALYGREEWELLAHDPKSNEPRWAILASLKGVSAQDLARVQAYIDGLLKK